MVIDFRTNEKTIGDVSSSIITEILEILDQLESTKYFSVFDLASRFHQIPMYESDAQKSFFHFTRALLIQSNAIRIKECSRHIPKTHGSSGLQRNNMFVYLDDIVIYASSLAKNQTKFNKFAERLRQANLKLQPDKCEFLQKEVNYLGL